MPKEYVKRVVNSFAQAAVRAKKAGYDGVEIHACHGYLLNPFATPAQNHRTDEYGGSRENHYRLTVEVYEAIRRAVGSAYQVWIKVMSQDGFPGGIEPDDCLYPCNMLAEKGIDAIEVSGNFFRMKGDTAYFKDSSDRILQGVCRVPFESNYLPYNVWTYVFLVRCHPHAFTGDPIIAI